MLHIILHFLVPLCYSAMAYKGKAIFKKWLILVSTMAVDLDHLLATPVYDPHRCSIGFHPLHTYPAIIVYAMLLFPTKTRLIAIGLLIHMLLDYLDCIF